ncbi:MAG: transposase [Undibacterium sp.]|nr:transposase [Opitutaceae bacterium]
MNKDGKVAGASCSRPASREQDAPATLAAPATLWEYFNPLSEIDIRTGGNLPHWEQGPVWYFVTFRLADALPPDVVEKIQQQREQWRRTHDLKNLSREKLSEYHQLFSERYDQLLNAGSGSCVLRDPTNADIVHGALRFFDRQRYVLDEYVVMPNHVHVLVKPLPGHELADLLHSWKSYTANQLNRRLGRIGQLWQHESYDHIVRNEPAMDAIRRYIRENPTKVAGASSSRLPDREQDAPATIARPC